MAADRKVVMRIIEAIQEVVADDNTSWNEKRDAILQEAARQDSEFSLKEFLSWFDDLSASELEEEEG